MPRPTLTFENAQEKNRPFSDEFVDAAVNGSLRVGDEKIQLLKAYFDQVPVDNSDNEFVRNPGEVKEYRDDLSDFVINHLRLIVPRSQSQHAEHLKVKKRAFLEKVDDDKKIIRDYIDTLDRGREPRPRYPESAFDFQGLRLPTEGGEADLLEGVEVSGIRANLQVQSGLTQSFLHWTSRDYLKRQNNEKPKLTRRIYLNPRVRSSIRIFSEVIDAAEAAGLQVKGKILDRSGESELLTGSATRTMRGDGIVMYVSEEESNRLLGLIEDIYKNHYADFAGRKTSRVAMPIGEGVAVGDEPEAEGESLTSHRAKVMEGIIRTLQSEKLDEEARLRRYHELWRVAAKDAGINPHNPAFNKK
jgi:hypothetical protein